MVVRVRLWSNTNLERGEAPIGLIPVWAGGEPGTPYCLSLSLCLSPTDALQVELRRIWAMQRPDLNRLTDRETEP